MIDLVVVIVNWNSKNFLQECLRSIFASKSQYSYQVIVIDNGSTDGSVEMVKNLFPAVNIEKNTSNTGFARANNQILKHINSNYALLLNADTIVNQGAFDVMLDFLNSSPGYAVVGPAILNGDSTPQRTGARFPTNWSLLVEALFLDRLFPQLKLFGSHKELYIDFNVPREVDYVQGSCLMVKTSVLRDVGYLDERFFMYFEETDLCFRVKKAGWKIWFLPTASVIHFGGGETAHYDEWRIVHYHNSLFQFYSKHYSYRARVMLRCILFLRSVIRVVVWSSVTAVRPSLRHSALSAVKGYLKTLQLVYKEKIE
jgi:GT2 family glycosyltransferase